MEIGLSTEVEEHHRGTELVPTIGTDSGDIATAYVRSANERVGRGRISSRRLPVERAIALDHRESSSSALTIIRAASSNRARASGHRNPERFELAARQAAAHPEHARPSHSASMHADLLDDAQRIVPRQDHAGGSEQDSGACGLRGTRGPAGCRASSSSP